MQSVQNLKSSAIILKRYEIECQLVLITNRNSNTSFLLVRTSVTLNGLIAFILRSFTEYDSFAGRLCHSG